jgi:hypothetical protein
VTSHIFEHVDQLELFRAHADGIDTAFFAFHAENPEVYQLLRKFACQAKGAGRKKFGMKMLFERVRDALRYALAVTVSGALLGFLKFVAYPLHLISRMRHEANTTEAPVDEAPTSEA